ncbi:glycosyltransferase family 87 protein [Hamadaea sp. NPDC051192]|uniref:glycosyltransferase family 87 protein n=1 Tax=Hamadaea sp. NPDC051192 TaxID=3154940 RepID=UPI003439F9F8
MFVRRISIRVLSIGRPVDVAAYALAALFCAYTWHWSALAPHRAWAAVAIWGYLAAASIALLLRGRLARTWLAAAAWAATALLPLILQARERAAGRLDRAQEEVLVIEAAGARMLHTGTPYLDRDAIAAVPSPLRLLDYLPYQPGMAIAGLPRALGGIAWWTDARIIMALLSSAAVVAAWLLLDRAGITRFGSEAPLRALQAVTILPLATLTLATGGDDVPVLALSLLACALASRNRWTAAGLAIGCAGALKLTAWPVAIVLGLVALVRHRRSLARYALGAAGIPVLVLVPTVLINGRAVVENVIRFPLGHGLVRSPAASPLPGHLLTAYLPDGRQIAVGLLLGVAAVIAISLIRQPPVSVPRAALISATGLLLAILLLPATRFGYLLYPVALAAWAPVLSSPPYRRSATYAAAPRP